MDARWRRDVSDVAWRALGARTGDATGGNQSITLFTRRRFGSRRRRASSREERLLFAAV